MPDHSRSMLDHYTGPVGAAPWSWRRGVFMLAVGLALAGVAVWLDPVVSSFVVTLGIGGDLKREMEFVQQFGAITSCILIGVVVLLLDPEKKGRLVRAAVALATNAGVIFLLKMLVGRPRPRLGHPYVLCSPWETFDLSHTVRGADGERATTVARHAWEFWSRRPGVSDLWSFPSSHTAAAFALAAVLSNLYPRLRPLVLTLAAVSGVCRVLFNAHYLSDVIAGGTLGWAIASLVMSRGVLPASKEKPMGVGTYTRG